MDLSIGPINLDPTDLGSLVGLAGDLAGAAAPFVTPFNPVVGIGLAATSKGGDLAQSFLQKAAMDQTEALQDPEMRRRSAGDGRSSVKNDRDSCRDVGERDGCERRDVRDHREVRDHRDGERREVRDHRGEKAGCGERPSGCDDSGSGGGVFRELALLLGKAMGKTAEELRTAAKQLGTTESGSAEFFELYADVTALSQQLSFQSNNATNSIKTFGEAATTLVKK